MNYMRNPIKDRKSMKEKQKDYFERKALESVMNSQFLTIDREVIKRSQDFRDLKIVRKFAALDRLKIAARHNMMMLHSGPASSSAGDTPSSVVSEVSQPTPERLIYHCDPQGTPFNLPTPMYHCDLRGSPSNEPTPMYSDRQCSEAMSQRQESPTDTEPSGYFASKFTSTTGAHDSSTFGRAFLFATENTPTFGSLATAGTETEAGTYLFANYRNSKVNVSQDEYDEENDEMERESPVNEAIQTERPDVVHANVQTSVN
ncbi:hypothetical protein HDE_13716 [Halotydeus destructor]|nr:hypothetical protein HDE_13716 [Halotydeus destructor]